MSEKMTAILAAREQRVQRRNELLKEFNATTICFSMNIAGEEKNSPLVQIAFQYGIKHLTLAFPDAIHTEQDLSAAGPVYFLCTSLSAQQAKELTVSIEGHDEICRLFDMDVYDASGIALSRNERRACMLCGGPVDRCVKAKTHRMEEIIEAQQKLLREFAAEHLAETAVECLLEEVRLTPKPGLVDAENNGSHKDMDLAMFERSAMHRLPYFKAAVLLGMEDEYCMDRLQPAGVEAEKIMFSVTGGVNTHKGAIYAFGLILAAIGSKLSFDSEIFSTACVLAMDGILPDESTHGSQVRKKYNRCGARYEATEGFPNAISAYNVLIETGSPYRALLWLIASVPDTNLLYRGGIDGLVYAQELAKKTQALDDEHLLDGIREMDKKLTEHHLSPGGSADLLALSLFLLKTEEIWSDPE